MRKVKVRWQLVLYDIVVMLVIYGLSMLVVTQFGDTAGVLRLVGIIAVVVFATRFVCNVYGQIWRYGGIQCYIRLIGADVLAFIIVIGIVFCCPAVKVVSCSRLIAMASIYLLATLTMRMMYRYAFKYGNVNTRLGRFLLTLLKIFAGKDVIGERSAEMGKTYVAIIGAGRVGVSLAEELIINQSGEYIPHCFVDIDRDKVGREILGLPVLQEDDQVFEKFEKLIVREVIFALPDGADVKRLYDYYSEAGYRIKVYDYSLMEAPGSKRQLREFDIEELLFRKPVRVYSERSKEYYRDKVILVTGGGGSIGSEICRQLAEMAPKRIVILDIYENGAYDVQQELRIAYQGTLDVHIEILSVTNRAALEEVFVTYSPDIVIHAAAHKHVPLMEHNCIEAVENNVFGTLTVIELCEKYGAERFMMISTDKAVNPTNVMGATKRMCEMLVQSASTHGRVKYSATRFGNVLGSAGSVIPLFRKQIANGGPVTLTDRRIIRYFMTISEASHLVLESGAMAANGELFVLDMGEPVRILDLANNMIRLSGVKDVEVVEIGLRPGEKLFEELLVKTEELDKTENSLIFIERDRPLVREEMKAKLDILRAACDTGDNDAVRDALKRVVPTYRSPEEVNASVGTAE